MDVLNISRLRNQIKGLKVIGINDKAHLVLKGFGERIQYFGLPYAHKIKFYEYNPASDELTDIFNDLICPDLSIPNNSNELGGEYFFEVENEEKVNIIKCDFNHNTYEHLFSACSVDDINNHTNIQLISLTDNYLAVKTYNKTTCEIYIYDQQQQKKYDLLFSEDDDMRYAKIQYLYINQILYILVIKKGGSDFRMKHYIHKCEWVGDSKEYKDEKMFLFALQELADKGSIYLDDEHKIEHADERYELKYHNFNENCIIYSKEDFERYSIDYDNNNKVNIISTKKDYGKYKEKKLYENNIFFYDVASRQTIKSIPYYYGYILVSNKGCIFHQEIGEQLILTDLIENNIYALPYDYASVQDIIGNYLIIREMPVIIIYDLKNKTEIGRYYTEYKGLDVSQPEVREMFIYLNYNYKYFEKEDLLVLY